MNNFMYDNSIGCFLKLVSYSINLVFLSFFFQIYD